MKKDMRELQKQISKLALGTGREGWDCHGQWVGKDLYGATGNKGKEGFCKAIGAARAIGFVELTRSHYGRES